DVLISQEKEMLGVYITAHPLQEYDEMISRLVTVTSRQLLQVLDQENDGMTAAADAEVTDGMTATMAGIVTGKKTLITKNNKMMAFADLEDLYGNVEVVVFPNIYEKYSSLLEEDRIVAITGSINFKEGEVPKLLADRIVDLKELRATEEPEGLLKIRLPQGPPAMIQDMIRQISRVMKQYPGSLQTIVYLPADESHPKGSSFRTRADLWVDGCDEFRQRIIRLVGEENYKG
ncbi:MAG: hypothetical protein IJ128_02510, partial [Firmicutes bacterium]|nr:hypothetical protein [Bacillota bacterium]